MRLTALILLLMHAAGLFAQTGQQVRRVVSATPHVRAHVGDMGFVLTAMTGEEEIVLGYSDESDFDDARRNPAFLWLLERFETAASRRLDGRYWGNIYRPSGVKDICEPLCSDVWHQYSSPYFDLCPTIDGNACVTGCVATAMAQIMRFHRFPVVGRGSHTYSDSLGCKQELTADFSSHYYDWDYMLDEYTGKYSEREGNAVARLMSDCGIAVNMRYGVNSSGALSVMQPRSLVEYFDYSPGMIMRYRNFYTQVEWDSIMFTELSEGRPMIVSGASPGLSHSFICDGYDEAGFFHVNFGNEDGHGNGYYYYTFLTPDMPEYKNYKDSAEGGFNLLQGIITGIEPRPFAADTTQHFLYAFSHLELLEQSTHSDSAERDYAVAVHNLGNVGWNEHYGTVGLGLVAMDGSVDDCTLLYEYDRHFLLEEICDSTYTDTINISRSPSVCASLTNGAYRLVPVYMDGDGHWVEARTMVGIPNYLTCSLSSGTIHLQEPENEHFDLKVVSVEDFPEYLKWWSHPEYSITLRNEGVEYSGRFFVALYTDDAPDVNVIIAREGLSIGSGETVVRPFKSTVFERPAEGIYHLRILADIDLFTDSLVTLYDDSSTDIHVVHQLPDGIANTQNDRTVSNSVVYDFNGRIVGRGDVRNVGKRAVIYRSRDKGAWSSVILP